MPLPPDALALPTVLPHEGAGARAVERALVERVLDGEVQAFRWLVERHQRRLFTIVSRMVGSRTDAEDLTQQAFLAAYDALGRFNPRHPFSAWINRIAINLAKDHLKSKKRSEVSLPEDLGATEAWLTVAPPDPEAHAEGAERRSRLGRALAALSPRDREVLILKDMEDLSYREMREILGSPVTALKIRVIRARARLRKVLGREGPDG